MVLSEAALKELVGEILRLGGSEDAEARLVAGHLVEANLMGHDSHGVGLVPAYVDHLRAGLLAPNTSVLRVKDDGAILAFDGRRGYGRRVAGEAMDAAVERCRETGVVLAALRNAHHIGRVGAYGESCAAAGLISVHFVNVVDHAPTVAPFAGIAARFVTNPVCVALPGTGRTPPVLLDMATSKVALGKLRVAHNKGERIADGAVLDAEGRPSDDPGVMFADPRGAMLPFGDYKGSGLALICELLAGGLTGGGTIQPGNPRRAGIVNNMLTFAIDPARLVEAAWLRSEIDALVAYVKSSAPAQAGRPVMVAGDPEREAKRRRERDGIPVDETTWNEILDAGATLGLARDRAARIAGV